MFVRLSSSQLDGSAREAVVSVLLSFLPQSPTKAESISDQSGTAI